jgi:hypothetical protein
MPIADTNTIQLWLSEQRLKIYTCTSEDIHVKSYNIDKINNIIYRNPISKYSVLSFDQI